MLLRAERRWCLTGAALLAFSLQAQQVQAQEDCFNDDHRVLRNDLEPPSGPTMPALTVSDDDLATVLAAIAKHEGRASAIGDQSRVQSSARDSTKNE
ncbi:MAG: hypothetical protein ACI8W7_000395 [Gammaproteobacteria bacterium]|jgi:hypothetical protein